MTSARILVVDDEPNARGALRTILAEEGYAVSEAGDGVEALAHLRNVGADLVLADVRMPRMDGLTLLREARESGIDSAFVVMTAFGSIEMAVEAMRAGAENFLVKPLDDRAVVVVIEKALDKRRLEQETANLRVRLRERVRFDNIVGDSPALREVFEVVQRAAPTRANVLILGESGTGKELIAQALHELSPRKDRPFVRVNCGALTETLLESELFGHERGAFTGAVARREGRFERADGGTLFLDEIGDISQAVQVKLLRVIQTREFERVGGSETLKVDVRLLTATNKDLAAEVAAGRFREDLFYRLDVISVTLPPLRARKGDIPALVSHFLRRFSEVHGKKIQGLAPGTLQALLRHDWPGNVRELENSVERAVVLAQGPYLTTDDLPPTVLGARPSDRPMSGLIPGATWEEIEKEAILRTLEVVGGSTSRAAAMLGISTRTIQYRLKQYAQEREGNGAPPPTSSSGTSSGS
jgi:two-component system, NtrC family, response regulator